jgi:FKBP-type peptidyl-prolyl cis-trans isomerase
VSKKYLAVTIFLVTLILAGGAYAFVTKEPKSQDLQTSNPSATIAAVATPIATSSANPISMQTDKLIIQDEVVGTGAEAVAGKKITVNYAGTLTDGTKFDSSYDRNEPFLFTLGAGEVIQGWDQGFAGMKIGGKRRLTIPSSLAYGPNGIPGAIPGGATLIFEVELLKVE